MTDTAARTTVLRDALQAAVTCDTTVIARIYTEDVTGWSPVMKVFSRDDLVADLRDRDAAFSDVDLTLDPVDAVGDKLIAEWRLAATHSGVLAFDEFLLEPTGRRIELRGVLIAEFEGDRIRRFRHYWDEAELIDGLGLLPQA
jgi:predicted ester cyclase